MNNKSVNRQYLSAPGDHNLGDTSSYTRRLILAASVLLLSACGSDGSSRTAEPVTVTFAAMVGNETFLCGNTYAQVDSQGNDLRVNDFRLYISNPAVIVDQQEVALNLADDGVWQYRNIALLDFENGCLNGNPETNDRIVGTINASVDDVEGICFDVGVPYEYNHLNVDAADTPAPLNDSSMFWVWLAGHKFIRVDGVGDPDGAAVGYNVHLGSTGCSNNTGTGNTPNQPPASTCTYPNVARVCLDGFEVATSVVVADLAAVLAASDVSVNQAGAPGCMSAGNDPDCREIMLRLGVDYTFNNGVDPQQVLPANQTLFRLESSN